MEARESERIRALLLAERDAVLRRSRPHEEAELARTDFGRGAEVSEAAREALLEERDVHKLRAIERALARLASGDYGFCESCGWSIATGRLTVAPDAELCVQCQQREELGRLRDGGVRQ